MANSKVLIEVIATGKGLKVVAKDTEKVYQTTQKLGDQQKKTAKTTEKATNAHAKYDKQNKSVYQGNLSSSKSFSKMKETIGGGSSGLVQAYATLAANVFAATAAFNALRQASQVQQLVEGLQALGAASGRNLELLASKIKEASGNAIALDQALRTASVGASAGFSSSQIEGLASVARDAAIALGRDVGDAVDRLTRGAAKLEPEILDELGIFVRLDDASAKYAASIGVASTELTRFQQRQAFANEIITQGGEKFGELGDKVEASPFDRLAATLGDLSRTMMDFFNNVLGPVAEFLANNTVALAGLFAVLTKGLISTALPALNKFSESAMLTSLRSKALAESELKTADRKIAAQRKVLKPLKFVRGEYTSLFGKIKQGTATVEEQERANQKLLNTIKIRQQNIQSGGLKNLAQKKKELDAIKREQIELQKLIDLEKGRTGAKGAAQFFGAQSNFDRRGGKILGDLDKDIAEGRILDGFNKAMKATGRNSAKLIKDTKAATGSMKIMGLTASGPLAKGLRMGSTSMKIFGLTSKVAIKGIFTAIPVIGQLLLVIDLLIAGLKSAVGFFASFGSEQSELEKSTENLAMAMSGFAEVQSKANLENKGAAQSLIISSNATKQLLTSTIEASAAQKKAYEEANTFGKMLIILGRRLSEMGDSVRRFFETVGDFFTRIFLRIQQGINNLLNSSLLQGFLNIWVTIFNTIFAAEGEELELVDLSKLAEDNKRIQKEIDEIDNRRKQLLDKSNLSSDTFRLSSTMAEVKAFEELMMGSGAATRELKLLIGDANTTINDFLQDLGSAKSVDDLSAGIQELAKSVNDEGEATAANTIINKIFEDGLVNTAEAQQLLQLLMEEGTETTRTAGTATEELGNTFKNSGEKINTFFTNMREKSKFGPLLSEFKQINTLIGDLRTGEGGDAAFLEEFDKAPASLRKFIDNGNEVKNVLKDIELGTLSGADATKALADARAKEGEELQATLDKLIAIELIDKKRNQILAQQAAAVKQVKNNSAAVATQVALQNQISNKNIEALQTENSLYEQNLGIAQGEVLSAEQIKGLTDEQREIYAKILTNRVATSKEQEKLVSDEEKSLLVQQANLATQKAALDLLKAEAATLAKKTMLLNAESNIRKGMGGAQTPAQQLRAQKVAAAEAVRAAKAEEAFLKVKFEIERDILEMRLLAAGVEEKSVNDIIERMNTNFETQKKITAEKVKQAEIDEKMVGMDRFAGQKSIGGFGNTFQGINSAFDTAKEESGTTAGGTASGQIEIMADALKPMRDQLVALGPEGELVALAQQGILSIADAFAQMGAEGAGSAEKLAAVGQMIAATSAIMQAATKAQVAEIDNQIEMEQKRDGKSKESIAKIAAMEKKKESIQRKAFEQKKKMDIGQAIISTALGVTRALELGPIIGPVLAVMQAAMGMAQIAIIKKQQFKGSAGDVKAPTTNLQIGKRSNVVDTAQRATAGELNYLRGGRTTGTDLGGAGGSLPGAAMGRKGYADGGIVVGERGPEVITPTTSVDVTPNYELGGGTSNVNFTINAVDAAGVEDVLMNQRGNIIRMIREAANDHGEMFLEDVDTQTYGSNT